MADCFQTVAVYPSLLNPESNPTIIILILQKTGVTEAQRLIQHLTGKKWHLVGSQANLHGLFLFIRTNDQK